MKAIIYELDGPRSLVQRESTLDEKRLGENAVLAETEWTTVSPGTELAAWLGKPPLRPGKVYPRLVGYCNVAKVLRVGAKVRDLREGDFILTHQSHRSAFVCDRSDALLRIEERSSERRKLVSASYLYHLGYAALLAGEFRPGFEIAIVGMGALGIATASLARVLGTDPFLFTDQEFPKSKSASSKGVRRFSKRYPNDDFLAELGDLGGVDLVINTSNRWSDHRLSLQLSRKGGTIVCLGFPGRGEPAADFNPLDSQWFYDKQLTLRSCGHVSESEAPAIDARHTLQRNLAYLASLISAGKIDPLEILSRELPWNELSSVYEDLASRRPGLYAAALRWKR